MSPPRHGGQCGIPAATGIRSAVPDPVQPARLDCSPRPSSAGTRACRWMFCFRVRIGVLDAARDWCALRAEELTLPDNRHLSASSMHPESGYGDRFESKPSAKSHFCSGEEPWREGEAGMVKRCENGEIGMFSLCQPLDISSVTGRCQHCWSHAKAQRRKVRTKCSLSQHFILASLRLCVR